MGEAEGEDEVGEIVGEIGGERVNKPVGKAVSEDFGGLGERVGVLLGGPVVVARVRCEKSSSSRNR